MTDISITNSNGIIFTFANGEVKTVRSRILADIEQTALPAAGPANAFVFDFNGAIKVIEINGTLFETTTSRTSSGTTTSILAQKQWLEANVNGLQQAVTFASNYESQTYDGTAWQTTKIVIGIIEFTEEEAMPGELPFTATLLVGT